MKKLRQLFKRLRTVIALVAVSIFCITVLLPPLLGLLTRQAVINSINNIQSASLSEFNIESFSAETVRADWFSSEIRLTARGSLFSGDARTSAERVGLLHINHGPLIWHLSDSLLALADLQLLPLSQDTELAQHFSGSAIAQLTPALAVELKAIGGIRAAGGEHWLELQMTSPLLALTGTRSGQLWLDLDVTALTKAGLSSDIAHWLRNDYARLSNNRLLFYIRLQ